MALIGLYVLKITLTISRVFSRVRSWTEFCRPAGERIPLSSSHVGVPVLQKENKESEKVECVYLFRLKFMSEMKAVFSEHEQHQGLTKYKEEASV